MNKKAAEAVRQIGIGLQMLAEGLLEEKAAPEVPVAKAEAKAETPPPAAEKKEPLREEEEEVSPEKAKKLVAIAAAEAKAERDANIAAANALCATLESAKAETEIQATPPSDPKALRERCGLFLVRLNDAQKIDVVARIIRQEMKVSAICNMPDEQLRTLYDKLHAEVEKLPPEPISRPAPPSDPKALREICDDLVNELNAEGRADAITRIAGEMNFKDIRRVPDIMLRTLYDKLCAAKDLPF